jgi:hypothetical protein
MVYPFNANRHLRFIQNYLYGPGPYISNITCHVVLYCPAAGLDARLLSALLMRTLCDGGTVLAHQFLNHGWGMASSHND